MPRGPHDQKDGAYTIINGNGDYNLSNFYNVNYVNEAVKKWVKKGRLGREQ